MLENRHVEWFILVPFFYTVNCSSAAIINIGLNNEVSNLKVTENFKSIISGSKELTSQKHISSSSTFWPYTVRRSNNQRYSSICDNSIKAVCVTSCYSVHSYKSTPTFPFNWSYKRLNLHMFFLTLSFRFLI